MSLLTTLSRTRRWRQFLLEDAISPELPAQLPAYLKQTAQAFISEVPLVLNKGEHAVLDRWYASSAGQAALVEFVKKLWSQMTELAAHAMPAHDARHAMYKVPAAALEYMVSEDVQGWQRVGILGGLLHDHGRWAEERIYGEPGDSLIHARLSYLLGKELLEGLDIPERVKQHILLAAIRHTSGAQPEDPMPLKLTVSADRDQLYGPEIIIRIAHHMVNAAGDTGSFYGEKPGKSVLTNLSKYLTNRLPGPLFSRQAEVDHQWTVLATFVLMCEDAASSEARFRPIVASKVGVPEVYHPYTWALEWEQAQGLRPRATSAAAALAVLVSAPHTAPNPRYREEALNKLSDLPADKAERLAGALVFAEEQRWSEDLRQHLALQRIAKVNVDDRLVLTLTSLLLRDWFGVRAD